MSRQPSVESRPAFAEIESLRPTLAGRVVIENIRPCVNGGRFPIKRTVGEPVEVRADVFADGHERLRVMLLDRHLPDFRRPHRGAVRGDDELSWRETEMVEATPGSDEWIATFAARAAGWHEY